MRTHPVVLRPVASTRTPNTMLRAVKIIWLSAGLFGAALSPISVKAQREPVVTAADYARAERFLRDNVLPLVTGLGVQPTWLSNDRFGYRISVRGQSQFVLVDPARGTRVLCSPETDRCGGALDPREVTRVQPPAQRGPR